MNTLSRTAIILIFTVWLFPLVSLAGPVPDTGVTKYWDNTNEITCPQPGEAFYGQDAQYTINPQAYTKLDATGNDLPDSADSWTMVRDNVTGLIWEVKTDDGSIHDKDNTYTWYDSNPDTNGGDAGTSGDGTDTEDFINALNGENFGGHTDWRLPNINELQRVRDYSRSHPAINTTAFPGTAASSYWSATTYAYSSNSAWLVNLSVVDMDNFVGKGNSYYVRAVRGGQSGLSGDLVVNSDNTVTDTSTGLMWEKKTDDGGTNDRDMTYTWEAALSWVQGLNASGYLGYNDWRLPTNNELQSIVDYSRDYPAIDTTVFSETASSYYWSATTYAANTSYAWHVVFNVGSFSGSNKSGSYYVRAVRGGQSRVLENLVISSPGQASKWLIGSTLPITWDTRAIGENVNITLSRDGGKTWEDIALNTENDGLRNWVVSGDRSVNCLLKIEPVTTTSKGTTQGLFSIAQKTIPVQVEAGLQGGIERGGNYFWVATQTPDAKVCKIDSSSGEIVDSYNQNHHTPGVSNVASLAYDKNNHHIYNYVFPYGPIYLVDANTLIEIPGSSFNAPASWIHDIAFDSDNNVLWAIAGDAISSNFRIYKINPSDGSVLGSFTAPANTASPWGITWDGAQLWICDADDYLYRVDPDQALIDGNCNNAITRSIYLPDLSIPSGRLAWDGTNIWTLDTQNKIFYEIDILPGTVTINFDDLDTSSGRVGRAALNTYLANYHITITDVFPDDEPSLPGVDAEEPDSSTWSSVASSPPNFLQGHNGETTSFTLVFDTPLDSFGFTRTAYCTSLSYPAWTAVAKDVSGMTLDTVGESAGSTNAPCSSPSPPAEVFTFSTPGIKSVTITSGHEGWRGRSGPPLDDFVLKYASEVNPDADADGMPDVWETANGLNPAVDDSLLDPDNDKFVNGREFQDTTDPQSAASHFVLPPVTGRLPDTGQTASYTDTFGEDSDYMINTPAYIKMDAQGYYLPDSATAWVMVYDVATGLIWEVKTDDGTLHDRDNTYTWYDSNPDTNGGGAGTPGDGTDTEDFINTLNGENFGGHTDWRLPNINELQRIPDYSRSYPAIDTTAFPGTTASYYWSATTSAYGSNFAWLVSFYDGGVHYDAGKSNSYSVRAVRGGQSGLSGDLVINDDNTVTDTSTGLMWEKKTADGGTNDKDTIYTWEESLSWVQELNASGYLGYNDWRLPTYNELQSIVDHSRDNPAIDTTAFLETASLPYWSATTFVSAIVKALYVNFYYGSLGYNDKSVSYYVRAVRGGQNQLLDNLFISSPGQASKWSIGSTLPITWDTRGIGENVNITLSRDGGKTWEDVALNTENDGLRDWVVSGDRSVNCLLKIEPVTTTSKGTTQGLFSIAQKTIPVQVEAGLQGGIERGGNYFWVATQTPDAKVCKIDSSSGEIVDSYNQNHHTPGVSNVASLAYDKNNHHIYNYVFPYGPIYLVDANTLIEIPGSSFNAPASWIHDIAFDSDNNVLWAIAGDAISSNFRIYKINPSDGSVLGSFTAPANTASPWGITWDGAQLWICDADDYLYRVDPDQALIDGNCNNAITRSIYLPDLSIPSGRLAWDGTNIWTLDTPNKIFYEINIAGSGIAFPASPVPADEAIDVSVTASLAWTAGDLTYAVYLDTVNPPVTAVAVDLTTATFNPEPLTYNQTYYWKIVATDNTGALTSGPVWSFTTANPSHSVAVFTSLPGNLTNQTGINITIGGEGVTAYKYNLDGGGWSGEINVATPIIQTGLSDGSHTVQVTGKNNSGIWQPEGSASTFNWSIDTALPVISAFTVSDTSSGSQSLTNANAVTVVLSGSDSGGSITRWLITETADVPTVQQMTFGGTIAPPAYTVQSPGDGLKTLYAWIMDQAGNISLPSQASIVLDTATHVAVNGGDQCTSAGSVTLSGTKDSDAAVVVQCTSATVGTVSYPAADTWAVTITGLAPGDNTVPVTATDGAGNSASEQITVRRSLPANISFDSGGVVSMTADGTGTLTVTATVTEASGNPVCDGTTVQMTTSHGSITPTTYTTTNGQITFDQVASIALATTTITAGYPGGPLSGSLDVEMVAGSATRLIFLDVNSAPYTTPLLKPINDQGNYINIQIQDSFGHSVTTSSPASIVLSSSAGSDGLFSTNAIDWASQLPTTISSGGSSTIFWFKYTTSQTGDITITATNPGGPLASANMSVQELDSNPPTTTSEPAGGNYNSAQSVTLSCDDGFGSGCQATYYSTDGSTPTTGYATAIPVNADTTLKFYSIDQANNPETERTETYIIDILAPAVIITTPGDVTAVPRDTLNSIVSSVTEQGGGILDTVSWQISRQSDGTTYYLDTDKITWVTTPVYIPAINTGGDLWGLNISSWEVGKQYTVTVSATDLAGNVATHSRTFVYGVIPTEVAVQVDPDAFALGDEFTISGQVNEATTGNPISLDTGALVYLALIPNGNLAGEVPVYVTTNRTGAFAATVTCTDGVLLAGAWTMEAVWEGVIDTYLNAASDPVAFTVNKGATVLKLDLPESHTLKVDSTPQVTGSIKLVKECSGANLGGLDITVTFSPPLDSGLDSVVRAVQTDAEGNYLIDDVAFNTPNEWTVQAQFAGSADYLTSESQSVAVNAQVTAGYAVIVQGKLNAEAEGLADHNHTTNFVYKTLVKRGLDGATDIKYFNYETSQPNVVVDEIPTKAAIEEAITTWALERIVSARGDLYIVMVDHGWTATSNWDEGEFYIYPDTPITSTEMAGWLDTLQSGLADAGITDRRIIVVLGFCRSGAFVDELAGDNRIIISSAAASEYSHRGGPRGNDFDNRPVVEGELFVSEFFKEIGINKSVKAAFIKATQQTKAFTKKDENQLLNAPYFDDSSQHPLLEDNGDGSGTYDVGADNADGQVSETVYIGTSPSAVNDPGLSIQHISGDQFLPTFKSIVDLAWAKTNPVDAIWVEVKKPGYDPVDPGKGVQLSVETFVDAPVTYNTSEGRYEWTNLGFSTEYPSGFFDVPGTYQVFFMAKDNTTGETSPLQMSRVYKAKVGNQAPIGDGFSQVAPADGDTVLTNLVLDWSDVEDPDGGALTYTVKLSKNDPGFANPLLVEGLAHSTVLVTPEQGIENGATYYWKVQAVDSYGASVDTQVWSFTTDNTNAPFPCFLKGYVFNKQTGRVITGATVTLDGGVQLSTDPHGLYLAALDTGIYPMSVTAAGFEGADAVSLDLTEGSSIVTMNVGLTPLSTGVPGDVTGEGDVTIEDAVLMLQAMGGSGDIALGADITDDDRMDIRDVIYVLQHVSGLR